MKDAKKQLFLYYDGKKITASGQSQMNKSQIKTEDGKVLHVKNGDVFELR